MTTDRSAAPRPPRVGRIVTDQERDVRIANETAAELPREVLRSAFAIGERFVLTAWHCVDDALAEALGLWLRLRSSRSGRRSYDYVPVRVSNYDHIYDVAVLTIDLQRLPQANLTESAACALLAEATIPLGAEVGINDHAQVVGFPESSSSADSDTNAAQIVDVALAVGEVEALKLYGPAFAAVSPVNPHGLSGAPVLSISNSSDRGPYAAVGVIRAAPVGIAPGIAGGGSIVATRIADVADRLPEVGVAMLAIPQTKTAPQLLSLTKGANVASALDECARELSHRLVRVTDPELGQLAGWPHFFDEPAAHRRPTAIGTAYGLKLALLLGDQPYGLDHSALAATLWKLRKPDGGWAARTSVGISRPEVTALILGTLAATGWSNAEISDAIDALEAMLSHDEDPVGMERTYVVSAAIRGLLRVRPLSQRLKDLRALLLAGATRDPAQGDLVCWSSRLSAEGRQQYAPSPVHTAQAVIALIRTAKMLGEAGQSHEFTEQALRWLSTDRRLDNQDEQIRRFVADNSPWDTLTVRHFTAAWVARALLLASPGDTPQADALLNDAVRRVWQSYRNGIWEWTDHELPIWMSYQGASVLRDYALRTAVPL
jgi:Trypsin-like peptidase domain